ncbi:MAG TPA: FAD-binding protein [Spirochaetota bacterium]|nr:FAD-binding protein [Spirochaetota bacterium]
MDIQNFTTDVVVIGGGGAACRAAIEAAERGMNCIMVDKGRPGRSGATPTALWSIQAPFGARGRDERDSPDQFFEDMVRAGRFIGDQNIAEIVANTACDRILDMERYGVQFKKYDDGRFYQTPMPGQTYPRSCFMFENGQHMSTILAREVSRHDNIKVFKDFFAFHLFKNEGAVVGILGMDMLSGDLVAVNAKSTVIATGGYTSLWGFSDNPPTLTGDGVAMAYRAGAELVDLEFNQYYGTDVIWPPSVRGCVVLYELMIEEFADGEITDRVGNPIIDKPLPIRDEAIKTIFTVIKEGRGTEHGGVYFDTTKSPKGEKAVRDVFNTMTPKHYHFIIDAAGIDLVKEPLEVAPASHYQCGGVYINERGESSLGGLYACGEAEGNFQGANRLAGSALCDTQTMGAQVGGCAADDTKKCDLIPIDKKDLNSVVDIIKGFMTKKKKKIRPIFLKEEILKTMDEFVAPFRDGKGLSKGLGNIRGIRDEIAKISVSDVGRYNLELREAIEFMLAIDAAEITVGSALFRTESRGHHNRVDFPETDNKNWRCHSIVVRKSGKAEYSKRDVIYTRLKPDDE